MPLAAHRIQLRDFSVTAAIVAMALLAGCPPGLDRGHGCPPDTTPCGNGCRPAKDTVCCDDGTRKTSSYCTNSAGGGCFANDRGCQAGFPSDTLAEYCCASNGTFGSNDCPAGQHHCGLECRPADVPCCKGDQCTSYAYIETCAMEANPCAFCPDSGRCYSCPANFCCANDACAVEGNCISSPVCTGVSGGGGSDGDCDRDSDCSGAAICVSSRSCIKSVMDNTCECAGSTDGTCADFVAHGIDVTQCGTCGPSYTACCPGTMCVNGTCQASCP